LGLIFSMVMLARLSGSRNGEQGKLHAQSISDFSDGSVVGEFGG
jgi:hypothetical protein